MDYLPDRPRYGCAGQTDQTRHSGAQQISADELPKCYPGQEQKQSLANSKQLTKVRHTVLDYGISFAGLTYGSPAVW